MDINEVVESLKLSITSGNEVPVTRATVKADELRALLADHARLQDEKALLVEVLSEVEADAYRLIEALKDSQP